MEKGIEKGGRKMWFEESRILEDYAGSFTGLIGSFRKGRDIFQGKRSFKRNEGEGFR